MKIAFSFLIFFVLSFSFSSFSQVDKYRAFLWAFKGEQDSNYRKWNETSVLITVDIDNMRIKIFTKETDVYDVVRLIGTTNSNGQLVSTFECVDSKAKSCRIRMVLNERNERQLYVDYNNYSLVYQMRLLD